MTIKMARMGWWRCGRGHVFQWGHEDWHPGSSQPDGAPTHCTADLGDGSPCLDSTHLWGPFASAQAARDMKLPRFI